VVTTFSHVRGTFQALMTRPGHTPDEILRLEATAWSVLPRWGSEGWDAGSWPYIIFAVARTRDGNGELFGYGTYIEGDTATHWLRSQGRLLRSNHRRGALPLGSRPVRRPRQPPRHPRGTAGPNGTANIR
jgi:hypothetical protein